MKKSIALCCLGVGLLFGQGHAQAAEVVDVYTTDVVVETTTRGEYKPIGMYITPKLVYGYTVMDKIKGEVHVTDGIFEGGASKKSRKDDDTWGGAIAIGYDLESMLNLPMRGELEYQFFGTTDASASRAVTGINVDGDSKLKNKMDIQTLFFNAYFDFKNESPITPYLGAGLGLAFIDSKTSASTHYRLGDISYDASNSTNYKLNTNFAWNVGAGLAWEITDMFAIDLGYRFVGLGKVKSRESSYEGLTGDKVSYKSKVDNLWMHQVLMGLRFTF